MSEDPGEPPRSAGLIRPFLGGPPAPAAEGRPTSVSTSTSASGASPPGRSVRPFLVTAGRTAPAGAMGVETQVMTTERGETAVETLTFEYRDIVALCAEPVAVAEIAAQLSLHLGVIRVLVTDLQRQGLVTTNSPEIDPTDDVDIIMRVINGLQQRT